MRIVFLILVFVGSQVNAQLTETTKTTKTTTTVTKTPKAVSEDKATTETSETRAATTGQESSGIPMSPEDSVTSPTGAVGEMPAAVCRKLADAARNKDFETFKASSTSMPKHKKNKPKQKDFNQMSSNYMGKLQNLNCGTEIIADDHAVVEAQADGEKRLIPFVREESGWKFDVKTYQSFYHTKDMSQKKNKMRR